jgi:anti-sigma regulatory factor (Ser/Thr protein kinase)
MHIMPDYKINLRKQLSQFENLIYVSDHFPPEPVFNSSEINVHEWRIDASSHEDLISFHEDLEKILSENKTSEKHNSQVALSAYELVQNAQEHAYHFEKGKQVVIHGFFTPTYDWISVITDGNAMDVQKVRAAIAAIENKQFGKRKIGMSLVKMNMDLILPITNGSYTDMWIIKVKNAA